MKTKWNFNFNLLKIILKIIEIFKRNLEKVMRTNENEKFTTRKLYDKLLSATFDFMLRGTYSKLLVTSYS